MMPMSKDRDFWARGYELIFVFRARGVAKIKEAMTVEFGWGGIDGWVVHGYWADGNISSGRDVGFVAEGNWCFGLTGHVNCICVSLCPYTFLHNAQ